ncbi:MAG: mannose-1-phosphate guanylyltransferase/mannose-6-phosphate isomerase [Planctomycetota bacterium]|jgi:mannose-1-phosphate guanylyltransferase|nr:mannose-1-phosphate guanylyltransferase/mannose-6-phosphate isomerase [Planctomycetota bacterium]
MLTVILCGGSGSRLWPLSRDLHPKPFIRLPDGESLAQKSRLLAESIAGGDETLVVTNRLLEAKLVEEFREIGRGSARYILEPEGRNTAPAVAAAALDAARRHGRNIRMLYLAADHLVGNRAAFAKVVEAADKAADAGHIALVGVDAKSPKTSCSYLESGPAGKVAFYPKPGAATAERLFDSGRCLWNTGIMCVRAKTLLDQMARHCPDVLQAAAAGLDAGRSAARGGNAFVLLDPENFAAAPSLSIDDALLAKTGSIRAVHGDMGWNGVDSWESLSALYSPGDGGNRSLGDGEALFRQSTNTDVFSHNRLVAALGLDGHLVVDSDDVLLVAKKDRADDAGLACRLLRENRHPATRAHRTEFRPWGNFTLLEPAPRFKIKRLELKPGAAISLQLHRRRNEHWIVVEGIAEVTRDDETFLLATNESTYIKAGHTHRVGNPGRIPLVLVEVQSGDYLGEDDIVRFEDVYGRI